MDHEKWNGTGLRWNNIIDFCKKNIRYISAGVAAALLVVVLSVTAAGSEEKKVSNPEDNLSENDDPGKQLEPFKEDAIPEIHTLIENYYTAYAAGDLEALSVLATPISDTEKGYITLMSQYTDSHENIKCYTKPGLSEEEYAVSVVMDVHFSGVDTVAPGLDFFYVKKNDSGAYYIDNRYSQFNLQRQELELDSQVKAYIDTYEAQKDVVVLCEDVQTRYEAALAADEKLKLLAVVTIPGSLSEWMAGVTGNPGQTVAEDPGNDSQDQPPAEDPGNNPQDQPPADDPGNTPQEPDMQSVSETVYLTKNVNIRKEPSETSEKIAGGVAGQSLTRTGIRKDGWSQVSYNGGIAYIKSEYLSLEKPTIIE